ncbi:MAG: chemotaxis protein CheW [Nitrospirota bacterium]
MSAPERASQDGRAQRLVVFRLTGREYGIQLDHVREVLRLRPLIAIPHAPPFIEGVASIRGHLVAVLDLRKSLGLPAGPPTPSSRIVVAVVNRTVVGFLVDEVVDVLELEESMIEPTPPVVRSKMARHYVIGVGRLGDRMIGLLNAAALLAEDELAALAQAGGKGRAR